MFIQVLSTEAQWRAEVSEWGELWNFPHCIGAIDEKNVVIEAPCKSNGHYCIYKDQFSIVLRAIVAACSNFIYAYSGAKGRASDSGRQKENRLILPHPEPISKGSPKLAYVILCEIPLISYPGIHDRGTYKTHFQLQTLQGAEPGLVSLEFVNLL